MKSKDLTARACQGTNIHFSLLAVSVRLVIVSFGRRALSDFLE